MKPYFSNIVKVLLLASSAGLSACLNWPDCGYQREPTLDLAIDNGLDYTSAYVVKNNIRLSGSENSYSLPISLNDDSTVYVFHSDERTDTLELEYMKNVGFESGICGFTLKLDSLQTGALTSFQNVEINKSSIYIR